VPSKTIADDRTWTGTMTINGAKLGISLNGKAAPQAVSNFISLAQKGFYKGAYCPRLTTKTVYILQCGSPTNSTAGGPGYSFGPIENAPTNQIYKTGVLAMARTSDDASSQGSQFFIIYGANSTFPNDTAGGYTVFGSVTSGLSALKTDVVKKGLVASASSTGDGAPKSTVKISSVTVK
jgi:peptidyl-prolyl cis-trans isomerase B (cyclophilin B)